MKENRGYLPRLYRDKLGQAGGWLRLLNSSAYLEPGQLEIKKGGGGYRSVLDGILQFGDGSQFFSAVFVFVPSKLYKVYTFLARLMGNDTRERKRERFKKNKIKTPRVASPRLASPPPETCSLASVAQSCF